METKGYLFSKLRLDGPSTVIGYTASASIGIIIIKILIIGIYIWRRIYIKDKVMMFNELSPEILVLSCYKTI